MAPPAGACLRSLRARGKVHHRNTSFNILQEPFRSIHNEETKRKSIWNDWCTFIARTQSVLRWIRNPGPDATFAAGEIKSHVAPPSKAWCNLPLKVLAPPAGACLRSLRARGKVHHRSTDFKISQEPFRFSPCTRTSKKKIPLHGAPSGIRTRDPLIKSQLLYQLS